MNVGTIAAVWVSGALAGAIVALPARVRAHRFKKLRVTVMDLRRIRAGMQGPALPWSYVKKHYLYQSRHADQKRFRAAKLAAWWAKTTPRGATYVATQAWEEATRAR